MGDGSTILLVEDEPDLRTTLTEILLGEGYRASSVEDLSSATEHINDHGVPDLALIDFRLPDGLGSELYTALQRRGGRALILSAQPRPTGNEVPPEHWISKGITVRQLMDRIREELTPTAAPTATAD